MIAAQRAADICRGDPIENGKAKRQGQEQQGFLDMAPVRINQRDQAKKEGRQHRENQGEIGNGSHSETK